MSFTTVTSATAADVVLNVGDKAPHFEAMDDTGKAWKSSDHIGKKIIVVYFYPADMTGGCTKQACGYRDKMKTLSADNVEVIGVSGDSVKNHQLFKQAEKLNFPLLADTEGKVAKAFGVPITKGAKSIKRTVGGVEHILARNITAKRWTFVIDQKGKIAYKNDKVKAQEDPKKIQEVIKSL